MRLLVAYAAVFVAAATPWVEVMFVVPAAIVGGLPPVPVVLVAAVGNVASLAPLLFGGERVRGWWRRRRDDGDGSPAASDGGSGRSGRARRLFERYGLPGLAALGPLVTGVHVAALGAMAAGVRPRRSLLWFSASILAWSVAFAFVTVLGIEAFVDMGSVPDVIDVPDG